MRSVSRTCLADDCESRRVAYHIIKGAHMSETTTKTTETKEVKKSKGLPTIAIVSIGCLAIIIIISIVMGVAGSFIFSKFGLNMMKKGIESQTGVSINGEGDGISITDPKTGNKVSVGEQKIPADFPADFPIYDGAKPTGSLSGSESGDQKGFWIVLTTPDSIDKVTAFYQTNLKAKGWTVTNTLQITDSTTYTVEKAKLNGTVTVGSDKDAKETTIFVTLVNKDETTSTKSPATTTDVPPIE